MSSLRGELPPIEGLPRKIVCADGVVAAVRTLLVASR